MPGLADWAVFLTLQSVGSVGGVFPSGDDVGFAILAHQLDDWALIFFGDFRFDWHV